MIDNQKTLKRIAEIRNNLAEMSDALRDELYSILKSNKDRTVSAATIQALYIAQAMFEGAPILSFGEMHDALKAKYEGNKPYLYIFDIFNIEGNGIVVTGYVIGGEIRANDILSLEKADGRDLKTCCTETSEHPSRVSHLKIDGLALPELSQGDRLVKL